MDTFFAELRVLQQKWFPQTQPLPGIPKLLKDLTDSKIHIALATSSNTPNYHLKTDHLTELFAVFPEEHRIRGDDVRIKPGRGKPAPDIWLLALKTINERLVREGVREILPEECLVFEDSVPGVESGRRAGMQVVWCPHPELLVEYRGREKEVLAGQTGEHKGEEACPGKIDDGWGRFLSTLESFPYAEYGIPA